jgi:alpha-1,2-mannosyltransferase
VLFPVALVAGGYWRSFAAAAVTLALFLAASVTVLGMSSMTAFIDHLAVSQGMADHGAVPWGWMPSVHVLALSLGAPPVLAALIQGLAALAGAICVWRAWRSGAAPFEAKAAVLLAASLLVSPYLFTYDFTWLAVAIGFLVILGIRDGFRDGERDLLFAAWLAPLAFVPIYWLLGAQLGCAVSLLLLILAMQRAKGSPSFLPR